MRKAALVFWGAFIGMSLQAHASAPPIAAPYTGPAQSLTPGVLCTPNDPNFSKFDYPEKIARCNRNVSNDEKLKIAAEYGNIPQADWPNYEFDHLIPLCAGGSDDIGNLWPQPIDQAHEKDKLETDICLAMKAGTLTQAAAVQKVHDWFNGVASVGHPAQPVAPPATVSSGSVTCSSATDSSLVARFRVIDDTHLAGISLSLNDNGDHEVISGAGTMAGVISRAKAAPLAGLLRYTIASQANQGSNDRFDLYVPTGLSSARQDSFTSYAKISFEGTYPNLERLDCAYDLNP